MSHPQESGFDELMAERLHASKAIVRHCTRIESLIHEGETVYLFTWNPNTQHRQFRKYISDGHIDYAKLWFAYVKVLKAINRFAYKYVLLPEVSSGGRLHVHGWYVVDPQTNEADQYLGLAAIKAKGFMKVSRMITKEPTKALYYYREDIFETIKYINPVNAVLTQQTFHDILQRAIESEHIFDMLELLEKQSEDFDKKSDLILDID